MLKGRDKYFTTKHKVTPQNIALTDARLYAGGRTD
jgi:hypothetical protein